MPTSKSAMKRIITSEKARLRNKARKTALKTTERKLRTAIEDSKGSIAQENFKLVFKQLDKAAKAGTITKNKRDRKKSQLSILYKNFASQA